MYLIIHYAKNKGDDLAGTGCTCSTMYRDERGWECWARGVEGGILLVVLYGNNKFHFINSCMCSPVATDFFLSGNLLMFMQIYTIVTSSNNNNNNHVLFTV